MDEGTPEDGAARIAERVYHRHCGPPRSVYSALALLREAQAESRAATREDPSPSR